MNSLPKYFKKLIVTKLTPKFAEAVELVTVPMISPGAGEVLVRNRFVGINASDINFTSGKYFKTATLPFDCGLEGIGEVVGIGDGSEIKLGQAVCYMNFGSFSEYVCLSANNVIPMPSVKSEYLPLQVSGLTAAISLDKAGHIKSGEKVLITAAAGGTGQFAVQIAKKANCHVIGTCSTDDKAEFLKKLGCDRVINYVKENLKEVLKTEYPDGIDVVYETIGGEVFDTCVNSLAIKGRLIVIGYISDYESQEHSESRTSKKLPEMMLGKSASVTGFLLLHYRHDFQTYIGKLIKLYEEGKLKSGVDLGEKNPNGPFKGIESIATAVEYLYSRKSIGKIIVDVEESASRL